MLLAMSVTLFCGVLCAVLAATVHFVEIPHLSRSDVMPGATEDSPHPLNRWLRMVGNLPVGLRGLSVEQRRRPMYTGFQFTRQEFNGLLICSIVGSAFAVVIFAKEFGAIYNPIALVVGAAFGWIMPKLWLRSSLKRRKRAILRVLPEVVDLLALCVGAGLDFLGSLNRVVTAKAFSNEAIIEELTIALQEMKLGKRRADALKDMAKRVNLQEMNSFVRTVVQADRMGTPIADVLVIHAEDVRLQRFVRAEREALKAPLKLLVPLIFFIMPCVAIIVGAPIFLQFLHGSPLGK